MCQEKRNTRATTPAVPTLRKEGSARNIKGKRTGVTRNMTVTRLQEDGMDVRGNASVTAM